MPIADLLAGMNGAFGVVAALHERTRDRRGRVVRTSLLAGMVGVHAFQGTRWTVAGEVPGLAGDHHPAIAPYGMFATGTAPIQIACGSEGLWRALCARARARPGRRRGSPTNPQRVAHRDELIALLEAHFADRAGRALAGAARRRPGCRPARCARSTTSTPGSRRCSQGLLLDVEHPTPGALQLPGLADPLRRQPVYSGGRTEHVAPPTLGQHNDSIRAWLGSRPA